VGFVLASGPVSTTGQPRRNTVGDIQWSGIPGTAIPFTNFPTGFVSGNGQNAFIFDTGIASVSVSSYDSAVFTIPGLTQMFNAGIAGFNGMSILYSSAVIGGSVPYLGSSWFPTFSYGSTSAYGFNPAPVLSSITSTVASSSGLLLTIQTPTPVIYSLDENIVCPSIIAPKSYRVTGCYQCPSGGAIIITSGVCSTCDPGMAILSSTGNFRLADTSLFLTGNCISGTVDELTIGIEGGAGSLSGVITFTSGVNSASLTVSGTLTVPIITLSNSSFIEGVVLDSQGLENSIYFDTDFISDVPAWLAPFGSIFGVEGSLWKSIVSFVAMIIIFLICFAFILYILPFFTSRCSLNCCKKNVGMKYN